MQQTGFETCRLSNSSATDTVDQRHILRVNFANKKFVSTLLIFVVRMSQRYEESIIEPPVYIYFHYF